MDFTNDEIRQLIDTMPKEFSAEHLIQEVILLGKVKLARQQMANGHFQTEEELDKEIDSWK